MWFWIVLFFLLIVLWIVFVIMICFKSRPKQFRSANEKRIIFLVLVVFALTSFIITLVIFIWAVSPYTKVSNNVECLSYNVGLGLIANKNSNDLEKSLNWNGYDTIQSELQTFKTKINDLSSSTTLSTLVGYDTDNNLVKTDLDKVTAYSTSIPTGYSSQKLVSPDPANPSKQYDPQVFSTATTILGDITTGISPLSDSYKLLNKAISNGNSIKANILITNSDSLDMQNSILKVVNGFNNKLNDIASASKESQSYFKLTTFTYLTLNIIFALCGLVGLYMVVFKKRP